MARKTKKQKIQKVTRTSIATKATKKVDAVHDADAAYFRHDVLKSAIIIASIITLEIIIYFGTMKYRFLT